MWRALKQLKDIFFRVDFISNGQYQIIRIKGRNRASQSSTRRHPGGLDDHGLLERGHDDAHRSMFDDDLEVQLQVLGLRGGTRVASMA